MSARTSFIIPREAGCAFLVRYVLENYAKHMRQIGEDAPGFDRYSSAACTHLVHEACSAFS